MNRWDSICITITVTPALFFVIITCTADFSDWEGPDAEVDANALYVSSATLIGLATFGSVLGIKLGKGPKAPVWNNRGVVVIAISSMMLIAMQWLIMLKACCLDFDQPNLVMLHIGTLAYLMGIMIGSAFVLEPSLNPQRKGLTKSP